MDSGGGGNDTGPMLEYGNKALGLQKEIYDQQRADAQPWYQTGSASVNQLAKLMGINTGASPQNRQSLIDQYTPQFTSNNSTSSNLIMSPDGRLLDVSGTPDEFITKLQNFGGLENYRGGAVSEAQMSPEERASFYQKNLGYKPYSSSSPTTDTAGLNSYVDNLIAQSQSNSSDPEFGKLAKSFTMDDYTADPGYQFRLEEGNKALERKLNASGKTYSPEAAKALLSYGQGLASEEYGNAFNRDQINDNNLFNRLATLSGFGQTANAQNAAAGSNYANAGGELYTGMGNAITSANVARAANNSSMFNTLLGAGGQIGAAYAFSDERLKENIKFVGLENGHRLYQFNYINIPEKTYIGVMAQDVLEIMPEAVIESEGYMKVNYDMIGVPMREVVTCH